MSATWDNFTYFTNDNEFIKSIEAGKSEPYDDGHNKSQLELVKRYLAKYPTRNRVMLDIGAHIGSTMLPYSRLFQQVYGFEPNRESYNFCIKNIYHNNVTNCWVENCFVLDRKTLGVPVQHNTINTGCFYFKEDKNAESPIPSKVLDEDSRYSNIDFIKIDTEGAEWYVLNGAINLIQKWKPLIQAEINGLSEQNFGISRESLLNLFDSLDYQQIPETDFFCHKDYLF
jgi:FkbM family methyltransferase